MSGPAKHEALKFEGVPDVDVILAAGLDAGGMYRTWTRGPQTGHDNGQMLSLLAMIAANIVVVTARHQKRPFQVLMDEAQHIFREALGEYVHRITSGQDEHDSFIEDVER